MTTAIATRKAFKAALNDAGQVSAVISVFDVIDSDGDIVRSSAFRDGQEVPMVWAHEWAHPVGKGIIHVESGRAVFNGSFFIDARAGQEAYQTVKAMGNLQEWSWGFKVTDAEIAPAPEGMTAPKSWDRPEGFVQYINGTEVFEVSPVLVGANRQTQTLDIKQMKAADVVQAWLDEPSEENATALIEAVGATITATEPEDGGKQPDTGWQTEAIDNLAAELETLADCP